MWKLKPKVTSEIKEKFPEISPILLQLLYNRNIIRAEDSKENPQIVDRFLSPEYEHLHSSFLFMHMQKACDRIWTAIEAGESIYIYGDYDADAVTANAVMQQTFRYLGVAVQSYIPDRFTEGYGLNIEAFKKIKADGASVVITVDCGTNSVDVAEYCKENGIDLIITDHHEITGEVPDAYALINPKNPADSYPDGQVTGVGVAYKLASALLSNQKKEHIVGWDKWLLDLVAIGTVADCHSLLGENRIMVALGLKVMAKTKWLGLQMLLNALSLNKSALDTHAIGFQIAPRINAAGRLEHADVALNLLVSTDPAASQQLVASLEQINKRRQEATMRVVSEAKEQAELISDRKILMVSHAEWPKGVVGLAAGRLAEMYHRPVLVLERGEVESTGSARVGNGSQINIVECLKSASQYLVKYGGHKQAAGLTVRSDQLAPFYEAMLKYADEQGDTQSEAELELEAVLRGEDISLETAEQIAKLEPFGIHNPKPVFMIEDATINSFRLVGSNLQHLQVKATVGSTVIDCIGFSMAYIARSYAPGDRVDIACELTPDSWNGNQKLKLR